MYSSDIFSSRLFLQVRETTDFLQARRAKLHRHVRIITPMRAQKCSREKPHARAFSSTGILICEIADLLRALFSRLLRETLVHTFVHKYNIDNASASSSSCAAPFPSPGRERVCSFLITRRRHSDNVRATAYTVCQKYFSFAFLPPLG